MLYNIIIQWKLGKWKNRDGILTEISSWKRIVSMDKKVREQNETWEFLNIIMAKNVKK